MNKKVLGLLLSGMLVAGMVGCSSTEDIAEEAYNDAKDKVEDNATVEEPKDEVVEPGPTDSEVRANKEALAENIKDTIANSMGSNYEVAVVIADDGNCNIAIADTTTVYSGYDKGTLEAMSKQYGLESAVINIETSAEQVFANTGYDVNVTIMVTGADYTPFMIVMHGIATYN